MILKGVHLETAFCAKCSQWLVKTFRYLMQSPFSIILTFLQRAQVKGSNVCHVMLTITLWGGRVNWLVHDHPVNFTIEQQFEHTTPRSTNSPLLYQTVFPPLLHWLPFKVTPRFSTWDTGELNLAKWESIFGPSQSQLSPFHMLRIHRSPLLGSAARALLRRVDPRWICP